MSIKPKSKLKIYYMSSIVLNSYREYKLGYFLYIPLSHMNKLISLQNTESTRLHNYKIWSNSEEEQYHKGYLLV